LLRTSRTKFHRNQFIISTEIESADGRTIYLACADTLFIERKQRRNDIQMKLIGLCLRSWSHLRLCNELINKGRGPTGMMANESQCQVFEGVKQGPDLMKFLVCESTVSLYADRLE
jgi:hypothetical protein